MNENVSYGIIKLPREERRARMMALLESFHIADLIARKPNEISGGQRQRAALARSLVTNPSLLLLDEPLVALDLSAKARILDDLRNWNTSHDIPILYVTHSPEEAYALGERVVAIESGRIVAQGTPQNVLATPRHETIAQWVGFENVFDATVRSLAESQGTMRCQLDESNIELEVPLIRTEPGARVRIAIRAGDIMLSVDRPHGLSARNAFRAKLVSMRTEGVTVILTFESGVRFEVRVTPGARDELGLTSGRQVWLVIKTYSCNLVGKR